MLLIRLRCKSIALLMSWMVKCSKIFESKIMFKAPGSPWVWLTARPVVTFLSIVWHLIIARYWSAQTRFIRLLPAHLQRKGEFYNTSVWKCKIAKQNILYPNLNRIFRTRGRIILHIYIQNNWKLLLLSLILKKFFYKSFLNISSLWTE